ncbi:MAG TPA: phosphatase PAP2 family protein [Dermatophilaceae bacterium]|nr:phosphatase PAP2 family protein [Dermatophilaceae bacterium]
MNRPRLLPKRAGLGGSVALTVACGVGFVTVYALTVRTAPGRQFGDASLRGALLTRSGVAAAVDTVLGVVSVAALLGGITVVAMVALARLQRVPGGVAVGLVLAANASTWLLKNHLLSRPDLGLSEVTPATLNSLPSGHTTAVFSIAVAMLFVVPPRWRRTVAFAGGAASIVLALATMSAGWHRAGDSIAAFALVGAWAGLGALVVTALDAEVSRGVHRNGTDFLSRRWLVALTAGTGGVAACLAAGLVLIPVLRASAVGAMAAFLAGALLIVAAAVAVLIGVQSVLAGAGR